MACARSATRLFHMLRSHRTVRPSGSPISRGRRVYKPGAILLTTAALAAESRNFITVRRRQRGIVRGTEGRAGDGAVRVGAAAADGLDEPHFERCCMGQLEEGILDRMEHPSDGRLVSRTRASDRARSRRSRTGSAPSRTRPPSRPQRSSTLGSRRRAPRPGRNETQRSRRGRPGSAGAASRPRWHSGPPHRRHRGPELQGRDAHELPVRLVVWIRRHSHHFDHVQTAVLGASPVSDTVSLVCGDQEETA